MPTLDTAQLAHDLVLALREAARAAEPEWNAAVSLHFREDDGALASIGAAVDNAGRPTNIVTDEAAQRLAGLLGGWLDASNAAGLPAWRCILVRTDRASGQFDLRPLYDTDEAVESWRPNPENVGDTLMRLFTDFPA